ncbi:MAG: metal ABC transporter permease [Alphaproteobacteria bacterium]|nr:metal ABC transporter permease [Alphaproteobacteria bacterium]MBO4643559.1 metal ABC transporter permease [Alphaproteobacteria bacterium]
MWTEPFILRGLIAAVVMAMLASPIGCLMIWRRMAYFSDSLSHSALAGVLLGIALGIGQNPGVAIVVCLTALLLTQIPDRFVIGSDLLLLIIGQTALCAGIIGFSYMPGIRTDLTAYLFGDVLSVTENDLIFIIISSCFCAVLLFLNWKKMIFTAILPDIAQSEGISSKKQSVIFMVLTALFVALAFKTTGILLISALLIIPPCSARFFAKTPEQMAFLGALIGIVCVITGLACSIFFDLPAAPAMEIICALFFFLFRTFGIHK